MGRVLSGMFPKPIAFCDEERDEILVGTFQYPDHMGDV
jgi:hypothetical protein